MDMERFKAMKGANYMRTDSRIKPSLVKYQQHLTLIIFAAIAYALIRFI